MTERLTKSLGEQLRAIGLHKTFTLHNQGGLELPVLAGVDLAVAAGECVVLNGPSGVGKSTLLRALYGNYLVQQGHILVRHADGVVDIASAPPPVVLDVRRRTTGFVSQFLRVIPRVATIDLVMEPLRRLGVAAAEARERAENLLDRLSISPRLWTLPPATFSGGEQQRVNIARGLIAEHAILLLDEPTAALDAANRDAVIELIIAARERGTAIVGIFHDEAVRDAVATRLVDIGPTEARPSKRRATRPELVFTNARIVTADSEIAGTVVVRDHEIAAIDDKQSSVAGVDLGGDYLLPGLIEMHTDNLEKHVAPRPGVRWPMAAAVIAHDSQIAAAGITTVFDALAIVGEVGSDPVRREMLHGSVAAIEAAQRAGLLRAEHLLHLRCEVANDSIVATVEPLMDSKLLKLVSLMDHTPGQRQFVNLETYRHYHQGKYGTTDAELAARTAALIDGHRRFAGNNRRLISALCAARGLTKATHDDATLAHIEEAVELGVTIAEFPTTEEAATAAKYHGMAVVMGAPNVVRGGSHSGNISARDSAAAGLLDILSSDYAPVSLLHAAFLLHGTIEMKLPEAVAKVSRNPARALGLIDRGEIAVGKRADLLRVRVADTVPVVREVWRAGERVV